jgi:hypothetical protein
LPDRSQICMFSWKHTLNIKYGCKKLGWAN